MCSGITGGGPTVAAIANGGAIFVSARLSGVISSLVLGILQKKVVLTPRKDQLVSRWSKKLISSLETMKRKPAPTPPKNVLLRLYNMWYCLPQVFRFFVGGNLGNISFFYTEQFLFKYLSTNPYALFSLEFLESILPGLSFFTAYLMQIVTTHLLFALLVYGLQTISTPEKYLKTLWGQFRVYAASLVCSTVLNSYLINAGVDKTVAFFGTMSVFACINYLLISWVVKRVVKSASELSVDGRSNVLSDPKTGKVMGNNQENTVKTWFVHKIQKGGAFINGAFKSDTILPSLAFVRRTSDAYFAEPEENGVIFVHDYVMYAGESVDSLNHFRSCESCNKLSHYDFATLQ